MQYNTFRELIQPKDSEEVKIDESEIKFQALANMKEIHSALAELTFLDVIQVMREENPLKKDVQKFEEELNALTEKVGKFVTDNMKDAVEMEQADIEDEEENKEEENEKEIKKAEAQGKGARKAELEKDEEE